MKSVMISVSANQAFLILNRAADVILRKQFPRDFEGWVYLYVTKETPFVHIQDPQWDEKLHGFRYRPTNIKYIKEGYFSIPYKLLNGSVVGRVLIENEGILDYDDNLEISSAKIEHDQLLERTLLTYSELNNYYSNEDANVFGVALIIKELEIFDKPKELKDFYGVLRFSGGEFLYPTICFKGGSDTSGLDSFRLSSPPRGWLYVWTDQDIPEMPV